jgi:hypothetical protein
MSTSMIYASHADRAALRRAGLPAAFGALARGLLRALWRATTLRRAAGAVRDAHVEAAQLRRFADQYRASDPGFAADLCAAADRHETKRIA